MSAHPIYFYLIHAWEKFWGHQMCIFVLCYISK